MLGLEEFISQGREVIVAGGHGQDGCLHRSAELNALLHGKVEDFWRNLDAGSDSGHGQDGCLQRSAELNALLHGEVEDFWRNLDAGSDSGTVSRFAGFGGKTGKG